MKLETNSLQKIEAFNLGKIDLKSLSENFL
jgi:hypothetical protein